MGRPRKTTTEPLEQKIETGADHDMDKACDMDKKCDTTRPELPKNYDFVLSVNKRQGMSSFEKIEEFAKALVTKWTREIERLRNKFSATQIECSEELDLMDEKIADAKEDFNKTWYDIPETALESKEAQRTFMISYENNIDSKLDNLHNLELQKTKIIMEFEGKLADIIAEVEEIQRRIDKIKN